MSYTFPEGRYLKPLQLRTFGSSREIRDDHQLYRVAHTSGFGYTVGFKWWETSPPIEACMIAVQEECGIAQLITVIRHAVR